jgi:hypothetical protein
MIQHPYCGDLVIEYAPHFLEATFTSLAAFAFRKAAPNLPVSFIVQQFAHTKPVTVFSRRSIGELKLILLRMEDDIYSFVTVETAGKGRDSLLAID